MATKKTQWPTSSERLVAEHLKASKQVVRDATRSPAAARRYLMRVGILGKDGKLAPHYRAR